MSSGDNDEEEEDFRFIGYPVNVQKLHDCGWIHEDKPPRSFCIFSRVIGIPNKKHQILIFEQDTGDMFKGYNQPPKCYLFDKYLSTASKYISLCALPRLGSSRSGRVSRGRYPIVLPAARLINSSYSNITVDDDDM